eukprot:1741433-Alexandrium_andersonii.AAC.1
MSASLVGSEMCIRDSRKGCSPFPSPGFTSEGKGTRSGGCNPSRGGGRGAANFPGELQFGHRATRREPAT